MSNNNLKIVTEEPISVSDLKKDEQVKQLALELANYILENVSKNWFSVFDLRNKLKIDFQNAFDKLQSLKILGLCYERLKKDNSFEYKIVLNDIQKIKLVEFDIEFYETKIKILKNELEKLKLKTNNVN